jgi:hypothetical protein
MRTHLHDRFGDALKPIIPAARQLIPKYFAHLCAVGEESAGWEVCFPGVLVATHFNGGVIIDQLHPVGDREIWESTARANIGAILHTAVATSMQVRDRHAAPAVSGGALLMQGMGVWSLVGGPELWNHSLTVLGLLHAEVIQPQYASQLLQYEARGIAEACADAEMSPERYKDLMYDTWTLK